MMGLCLARVCYFYVYLHSHLLVDFLKCDFVANQAFCF